ncbi:MAG: HAMP domain-containing protein, partial [Actinomycetota bacterium]
MRIRSKIVALIAVPLLILGTVAAIGFSSQSRIIETAEDAGAAIEVNQGIDRVVIAIGYERLILAGADVGDVEERRATTDSQLAVLAELTAGGDDDLVRAVADATADVETGRNDGDPIAYNRAVDTLMGFDIDRAGDYPSAESFGLATLGRLAIEALESRERAWLAYVARSSTTPSSGVPLATAFADANGRLDTLISISESSDTTALDAAVGSGAMRELRELEVVAVDDLADSEISIDDDEALAALVDFRSTWTEAIDAHAIQVAELVDDRLRSADAARSLAALMAILGTLVLSALVFVIHRSVTNPLERLMDSADEIANHKLPRLMELLRGNHVVDDLPEAKAIPVESTDEIGELVSAFNDVQMATFDLARDQAIGRRNVSDMFVNLGRRNQQLLQRILSQLTRLQQQEEDPETLRELFELDNA